VVTGGVRRAGAVCLPLGSRRGRRDKRVSATKSPRARAAATEYVPLAFGRDLTLLRVTARTGMRHQVRAHLALAGHPILGDPLYGGWRHEPGLRLFLHAFALTFRHPASGREVRFESPPPEEFRQALG
jgi:23S rRNA pseudouridine1911/1915/1917 synthase